MTQTVDFTGVTFQITTDFNLEKSCSECYSLRNFSKGDQVSGFQGSDYFTTLF